MTSIYGFIRNGLLTGLVFFLLGGGDPAWTASPTMRQTVPQASPQTASPVISGDAQRLAVLEQTLFNLTYPQDPLEARLGRLETTVFGEAQPNQAPAARLARLQQVLAPPPAPLVQQANTRPTPPPTTSAVSSPQKPAPGETDYPTVSKIEQRVLGHAFPQEDITLRLKRLEEKVFNTVQRGELAERVDNLRLVVLGENGQAPVTTAGPVTPAPFITPAPPQTIDPPATSAELYAPPQTSSSGVGGGASPDLQGALANVEQSVLRQTYPMEPLDARLDRLEQKVFQGQSPPGLTPDERLQRLVAVVSAGGEQGPPDKSPVRSILPLLLMLIPLLL